MKCIVRCGGKSGSSRTDCGRCAQDAATDSENLMVLNKAKSFIEFFACFFAVRLKLQG